MEGSFVPLEGVVCLLSTLSVHVVPVVRPPDDDGDNDDGDNDDDDAREDEGGTAASHAAEDTTARFVPRCGGSSPVDRISGSMVTHRGSSIFGSVRFGSVRLDAALKVGFGGRSVAHQSLSLNGGTQSSHPAG